MERIRGIPVTYQPSKIKKIPLNYSELYLYDVFAYSTKIGSITNCSTTLYEMQSKYEEGTPEFDEIEKRLKMCRKAQGMEIDKAKTGISIPTFPKHWLTFTKVTDEQKEGMTQEEIDKIDFNNKLIIEKRPYFMRYLYSKYNYDYKNHIADFDRYCMTKYGCKYNELPEEFKDSDEYKELKEYYDRKNPLLETNGTMNRICYYMESAIKDIKQRSKKSNCQQIYNILCISDEIDAEKLNKMTELYSEYTQFKRSKMLASSEFVTYEQYYKHLRNKALENISSNIGELANLAVHLCYSMGKNKSFAWDLFGGGIVENLINKRIAENNTIIMVPTKNENGDIEYLGEKYEFVPYNILNNGNNNEYDDIDSLLDSDLFDDLEVDNSGDSYDSF